MTEDYVSKRFERAQKAVEAARRDLDADDPSFAADHAYYAMFYIAEGLLAKLDLGFSSHGAVHGAYGIHFAKTGILDRKYHRWLLDAFEERQVAVYGMEPDITTERTAELIKQAEMFLAAAKAYLKESRAE